MLRLYNTLTRKIEDFKPLNPNLVTYYSCGPTVYDYAHLGHARTYIFADILERVISYNGYSVKRVMNITDVGHLTSDSDSGEDKMEKGAKREKKSVWDIAKFYTADFFEMCNQLNIRKPSVVAKATDYIKEMIDLIEILEKKGFTYTVLDGVYFDSSKFSSYGKLTGQSYQQLNKSLKSGARIEMVKGKKNATDFALWKKSSIGVSRQMEWNSPWGRGFPGWHIECSAMAMKLLGETIDIHTGGVDHIQIHHTNEIAQSEAVSGKLFVKFWLHAQHLLVEGEKMSKSLNNFFRLVDVTQKGFEPLSLRYLFLTSHYRNLMNFTWNALAGAQTAYRNLKEQTGFLKISLYGKERDSLSPEKLGQIDAFRGEFNSAINNDLNIPKAVAVVWNVLKSNIPSEDKYDLLMNFDEVLGLDLEKITGKSQQSTIPQDILDLADERERARHSGKWEEADKIRKKIEDKGYVVEDTPKGFNITQK
jgi:cysteinyl-tRNA synthetase